MLPSPVHASDRCPLLLSPVGTKDTKGNLETTKGISQLFFLILPVRLKDGRRSRWILQENDRLHRWCCQQGFGFCNHRTLPKIDVSLQHGL